MDGKWTDFFLRIKSTFKRQHLLPEIKNILTSPQNPKFQIPLTLSGDAHYVNV